MDYNFDVDVDVNEEEMDQSLKTKIANWRKRHPVLFIILIVMACLTVVFLIIGGLYVLFSGNSKEKIEDSSNYDVSLASNKIKYGDNTYDDADEKEDCGTEDTVSSAKETADQSPVANQVLTEEISTLEENSPEFAPWKQYQDTIYSVNSLKDFAKSKGYLDENNKITELGKDILCKKNSVTKGEYYAVSEKGVKEYKEYREEQINKIKEMLKPKEAVTTESAV